MTECDTFFDGHSEAWQAGYNYYWRGVGKYCPYEKGTREWADWFDGLCTAGDDDSCPSRERIQRAQGRNTTRAASDTAEVRR